MLKVTLIILATTFIIIITLFTFLNIQKSNPLLVDFTKPYELNESNHSSVSSFIEQSNDELKVITKGKIYDLYRQKSDIQVKEFTSEKEFLRQVMCEELTSYDIDYGGRLVNLSKCGPSGEETINLGSISY